MKQFLYRISNTINHEQQLESFRTKILAKSFSLKHFQVVMTNLIYDPKVNLAELSGYVIGI